MPDTTTTPATANPDIPSWLPQLRYPVYLRIACVFVALATFAAPPDSEFQSLVLMPRYALVVGIISGLLAIGLASRQRWAAWGGLGFDLLLFPLLLGLSAAYMLARGGILVFVVSLVAFAIDAAVLMRALALNRAASLACIALAAVVFGSVVAVRQAQARRITPLLSWLDRHWIETPRNLNGWELTWFRHGSYEAVIADQPGALSRGRPRIVVINYYEDRDGVPIWPGEGVEPTSYPSVEITYYEPRGSLSDAQQRLTASQARAALLRHHAPGDVRFVGHSGRQEWTDTLRLHSDSESADYEVNWWHINLTIKVHHAE